MTSRSEGDAHGRSVLALWEAAAQAPPRRRDGAVLRAAGFAEPTTLGERNARLLELHAGLFGGRMALLSHCPACGEAAEFEADSSALARQLPAAATAADEPHEWQALDHVLRFRLPAGDDLDDAVDAASDTAADAVSPTTAAGHRPTAAGAEDGPADRAFARRLLGRCIVAASRAGVPVAAHDLPDAVLDAVARRVEALDPGAALSFSLDCPRCATPWQAPLDAGELVWRKLRAAAERLLLDIDTLARTYGWSEPQVLALGPVRRAAYLQMAAA